MGFGKLLPANNATNQSRNPTLSWQASTGATSYEYCIDTTNDNACAGSWISVGSARTATLKSLNALTTYYWQVRARNAAGTTNANTGVWWRFTTMP